MLKWMVMKINENGNNIENSKLIINNIIKTNNNNNNKICTKK